MTAETHTTTLALPNRAISGMRPTGALHIGHYFGALKNWVEMQNKMETLFFVADWHALTTEYEKSYLIREFIPEMVKDWLVAGLDPEKTVIFRQSDVKAHAELHVLLSMLTPVSWLERCPTYKEQMQQLSEKDLSTYGFLGYPLLMTSDIILYRPRWVPVGQDQVPHIEISREIARRFNNFYGPCFPEPEAYLTPTPKCPGLDGRKMSKSYNNSIQLRESMETIEPKIKGMLTDKARLRRTDAGDPKNCNLYPYHELLTSQETCAEIQAGCTSATLGCVDCKKILAQGLSTFLAPMQERRAKLDEKPHYIQEVLEAGAANARKQAEATMELVRSGMGL